MTQYSTVHTTGYVELVDAKRPARATGEWSDVWEKAKMSGEGYPQTHAIGDSVLQDAKSNPSNGLVERLRAVASKANSTVIRRKDGRGTPAPRVFYECAELALEAADALALYQQEGVLSSQRGENRSADASLTPDAVEEYTPDQQRAADYIMEISGIGGGDDPVGFLIASHAAILARENQPVDEIELPAEDAALIFHVDGTVSIAVPKSMDDMNGKDLVSAGTLAATELLIRITAGELPIQELVEAFSRRDKALS